MFCEPPGEIAKWCESGISIYAFVQKTFWRVFLFGQWHWGNWANLLLMIPSLIVSLTSAFWFLKSFIYEIRNTKLNKFQIFIIFLGKYEIPFLAYMGILTFVTLLIAHVQIMTRILSSCPIYFWTIEKMTRDIYKPGGLTMNKIIGGFILIAHLTYFVVGPIIHCNGWNWT